MAASDSLRPETPGGPVDAGGRAGQGVPAENRGQPPVGLVVAQAAIATGGAHAQAPDAVDGGQGPARDGRPEGAGGVALAPQPRPRLRVGGAVAGPAGPAGGPPAPPP